jgi:hypothetical protein
MHGNNILRIGPHSAGVRSLIISNRWTFFWWDACTVLYDIPVATAAGGFLPLRNFLSKENDKTRIFLPCDSHFTSVFSLCITRTLEIWKDGECYIYLKNKLTLLTRILKKLCQ